MVLTKLRLFVGLTAFAFRGAKSEKGWFISVEDAIDLNARESNSRFPEYARFRLVLKKEFQRWREEFKDGATAFSFSDELVINLEVYLSHQGVGKRYKKALEIVRRNRPDLFGIKKTKSQKHDKNPKISLVYFIEGEGTGNIKIGHSTNPESRRATFQCGSPEKLILLKLIDRGEELEKELHKRFSHLRLHGEWFRSELELLDFIEKMV